MRNDNERKTSQTSTHQLLNQSGENSNKEADGAGGAGGFRIAHGKAAAKIVRIS